MDKVQANDSWLIALCGLLSLGILAIDLTVPLGVAGEAMR